MESNQCLNSSETVVPHRILQHLLTGTNHLLHPCPTFVDLECGEYPHVLCLRDGGALVDINLWFMGEKYQIKMKMNMQKRNNALQR